MPNDKTRMIALAMTLLLLGTALVAAPTATAVAPVQSIGFGFRVENVTSVEQDGGFQLAYCAMWMVGKVTSTHVSNLNTWISQCASKGTIPVIHWYYWMQYVGAPCVNYQTPASSPSSCGGRNQQDWFAGANTLADAIKAKMDDGTIGEAWVTIELEFNQGGADPDGSFDDELKSQSDVFQQRGIKTVAPFGSWSRPFDAYAPFVNDVDAVGTQILKGCTQHSHTEMRRANRDLRDWFWAYNNWSGGAKPLMVFDWGLSTFSGSGCRTENQAVDFEVLQRDVVNELFNQGWINNFRDLGVFSWIWRLKGDPGDSYPGYFGEGEKYFGFVRSTGVAKPAYQKVLDGMKAESQRSGGQDPVSGWVLHWEKEAESFTTKSTGAAFNDAAASGGQGWNIWANGHITDSVTVSASTAYKVNVTARGDPAAGVWPKMKITVGGTVAGTVDVTTSTWSTYTLQVDLAAGTHALKIEFTNDYNQNGDDRNLLVDKASVWKPSGEWRVEAESFTTRTAGASQPDANAAGGTHWNLWSNGHVSTTMRIETGGANVLRVAARGDAAQSVWPTMKVYVGTDLVLTTSVSHASWKTYRIDVNYPQGDYALKIEFTNDFYDPATGADRNLRLDYALVSPALSQRWGLEVEDFSTKTTGAATPDSSASNLLYWNLWTNGHVLNSFTTGLSGTHDIQIVARPDPAVGVYPHMRVWVDSTLVHEGYLTGSGWQTLTVSADFGAGSHTLKIEFTNDATIGTDDRNLHLDKVTIVA